MKNKDVTILKKILDYCRQLEEACDMFSSDYNAFVSNSVFQNACGQSLGTLPPGIKENRKKFICCHFFYTA